MIAHFSSKLPDEVVVIADNLNARAFLLAEGVPDQLPSQSWLADPNDIDVKPVFYCYNFHETHWVLAFLAGPFKGPEETQHHGGLLQTIPLTLRASEGPVDWLLVRITQ